MLVAIGRQSVVRRQWLRDVTRRCARSPGGMLTIMSLCVTRMLLLLMLLLMLLLHQLMALRLVLLLPLLLLFVIVVLRLLLLVSMP